MLCRVHEVRTDAWGVQASALSRGGLLAIDARGSLVYDPFARVEAEEWMWSVCHVLTHLGFGHADPDRRDGRGTYTPEWRAACCVVVDRFLSAIEIPGAPRVPYGLDGDEAELAHHFATSGIPASLAQSGPARGGPDLWEDVLGGRGTKPAASGMEWGHAFAAGFANSSRPGGRPPGRPGHRHGSGALDGSPSPWDIGLAAWFDERFPALEGRPRLALPPGGRSSRPAALHSASRGADEASTTRTFGVVVDTTGSMDDWLFDRALDVIASYAAERDVRQVRVAFCDADAHDAGWLPPQEIAGHVTLHRRRGAVLQPGVDLLLADPMFPLDGPILLITEGDCDDVRVRRDHAWLTSADLPFTPSGPVFHLA